WRDLMIEHLAADPEQRRAFLAACELPGVELALSTAGGVRGERSLPLLIDDEDWDALGDTVHRLCRDAPQSEVERLLGALDNALNTVPETHEELLAIAEMALGTIRRRLA